MKRMWTSLAIGICALSACSRTVKVESSGEVAPSGVMAATASSLPAGAEFEVELNQSISAANHNGDTFTAHVTHDVVAQDGAVVVPAGATVSGIVTGVHVPGDVTHPAVVRLDFERLSFNGRNFPFDATVEGTTVAHRTKEDLLKAAGIGAAAGGVLGAIIGQDVAATLIGGALGAGAGSLISLGINRSEAKLPEGTKMVLRNNDHVALYR
jgi:hypothetical protein